MAGRRCYFGDHPSITHTVSKKGVLTRAALASCRRLPSSGRASASCWSPLRLRVDDGGDPVPGLRLKPMLLPIREVSRSECPEVCRFSDAGNDEAGHTLGDRRRKSAKARNRGKQGLPSVPRALWRFSGGAGWVRGGSKRPPQSLRPKRWVCSDRSGSAGQVWGCDCRVS